MKNNIKFLFLSCLLLSTDIFAYKIGPGTRESYTLYWGITVRQLDLCTDWACTTPFNAFTGSQHVAVDPNGPVPGYDEISINIPSSGTYSHVRFKMDNAWKTHGYQAQPSQGSYCASGSSSTEYSTMAAAKAAATMDIFVWDLETWMYQGNGVDAPGYGMIFYGLRDDQTSIPGGYFAKGDYDSGSNTSEAADTFTWIMTRDEGNDDLYFTTVLQGDYDFGLGMPSTVDFGITVLEHRGIEGGICSTSDVRDGICLESEIGNICVSGPGEPIFDFVIQ
jgi:hypothetical protein